MKNKSMLLGITSLAIALVFALLKFTKIEILSTEKAITNIYIYPAGFFALLGLLLIYKGLKI